MNIAFEDSLRWIEQTCLDLGRNPAQATHALEEFRDSPQALDICWAILQSSRASSTAEFHILSAAKHALLFKWDALAVEQREQWLQWMEASLSVRVSMSQPGFLINKFMEVYVSIRKRSWLSCSAEQKNTLFSFIASCLENPSIPFQYLGASLLLYLVEEFHITTSADVNVPIAFYVQTKEDFQTHTVPVVLSLCWNKLNSLSIGEDALSVFGLFPILIKAIAEVVCWDYGSYDYVNNTLQEELPSAIHKPPRLFADILLQPMFLDKIFLIYRTFRQFQSQLPGNNEIDKTILELRNLIHALVSMNGDIFASDAAKCNFGNFLLLEICLLTEPLVPRRTLQLLTFQSDDYEDGGLRCEEIQWLLQSFSQLLTNFSLMVVVAMPQFTQIMHLIGQIALEICTEIDSLTADVRVRLQRSDFKDVCETTIVATWRFDIFTACLDIWTLIQDHFSLFCQSQDGGIGSTAAPSVASFRAWLMDLSEKLFPRALDCVLMVLVNDCLASSEDMTGEDTERIEERLLESLLKGTASLGRLHAVKSLQLLGNKLTMAVQDYQQVYASRDQPDGSYRMDRQAWSTKNLFCLEQLRLNVLLLHFLLVDDVSLVDGLYDARAHVSTPAVPGTGMDRQRSRSISGGILSLAKGSSGETPVISTWILQALRDDPQGCTVLWESFRFLASFLQMQVEILSAGSSLLASSSFHDLSAPSSAPSVHPCISPLLLMTVFRFFTSIVLRYLDPTVGDYHNDTVQQFPFLHPHSGSPLHAQEEIDAVLRMLIYAYVHVVERMTGETDLIIAASVTVSAIASHCPTHRITQLVPGVAWLLTSYDRLLYTSLPSQLRESVVTVTSSVTAVVMAMGVPFPGANSLYDGKSSVFCRLSDEGIIVVTEALGHLILKSSEAQHHLLFRSICEAMYNSLATLQSLPTALSHLSQSDAQQTTASTVAAVNLVLGAISGIIRCSATLDMELDAIYQLSLTAWQWMRWHWTDYLQSSIETVFTCAHLLRDFADFQLGRLSSATYSDAHREQQCRDLVQAFYSAVVTLFQAYSTHFRGQLVSDAQHKYSVLQQKQQQQGQQSIFQTSQQSPHSPHSPQHHHAAQQQATEPALLVLQEDEDGADWLQHHSQQQSRVAAGHAGSSDGWTGPWEEHLLLLLALVNLLSEKQFFVSSATAPVYAPGHSQHSTVAVAESLIDLAAVLCFGLEVVHALISPYVLRTHPSLCAPYISFLAYLLGGEADGFVRWVNWTAYLPVESVTVTVGGGGKAVGVFAAAAPRATVTLPLRQPAQYFQSLLRQLYSASTSTDGGTARQALQALQNLCTHQARLWLKPWAEVSALLSTSSGSSSSPASPLATSIASSSGAVGSPKGVLLVHAGHHSVFRALLFEMSKTVLITTSSSLARGAKRGRSGSLGNAGSSAGGSGESPSSTHNSTSGSRHGSEASHGSPRVLSIPAPPVGASSSAQQQYQLHLQQQATWTEWQTQLLRRQQQKLSSDRVDAFAGAYWSVLVLCSSLAAVERVHAQAASIPPQWTLHVLLSNLDEVSVLPQVLQTVMTRGTGVEDVLTGHHFTAQLQQQVWGLFRVLLSDRAVVLGAMDKVSRLNFAKNFRDFLRQLRSLTLA